MKLTPTERRQFVQWAKRATAGLDESAVMVGLLDDRDDEGRLEFELQIGHCLVHGKPLILIAPTTATVHPKLLAAASAYETYITGDTPSMLAATERALAKVGMFKRH